MINCIVPSRIGGEVPAMRREIVIQPDEQQIFLIDPDDIVRDSLKVLLESHGMPVQDFRTGADFLANRKALHAGCLVLGSNRLILDGLELIATLRRRGFGLPVIFIVGGGNDSTKAAALAAGASAYLERPVEETALIRAVKAALVRPNSRQAETAGKPLPVQP